MGWLCTQGMSSEDGSAESTEVSSFPWWASRRVAYSITAQIIKASDTCRLNQELLEFFAVIRVKYRDGGLCAMMNESACGRETHFVKKIIYVMSVTPLSPSAAFTP
jgi:hypothetical protein